MSCEIRSQEKLVVHHHYTQYFNTLFIFTRILGQK